MNKRLWTGLYVAAFLTIVSVSYALNLTRVKTWSAAEILTAADLNAEFDNILDHPIANADISASAAIVGSKLDLSVPGTIGGTTPAVGTFTNLTATGNTVLGNGADSVTINSSSGITYTPAATWTFTAAQTVSGTWSSIGIITTADINGGTIDGVTIGASSAPTVTNLGTVTTCDINGGTIDGVTIGGAAAPTVTNLGTVTTADINGGTIDGVTIGGASAGAGTFTSVTTPGLTATGDLDIGTYELRANTLESDVATGTAPFTIASTTVSTNLNADMIDGIHSTYLSQRQFITSSTTWTAPAGVTKVYLTMVGGGGGGAGDPGGGSGVKGAGGGGGGSIIKYPYTVVATNEYAVVIGAAGLAGDSGAGGNGGNTTFDSAITALGGGGGASGASGVKGAGGGGHDASGAVAGTNNIKGGNGFGAGDGANYGGGGGCPFGTGGIPGSAGVVGNPGTGYGAGGGGGGYNSDGGAGTKGMCLVEW